MRRLRVLTYNIEFGGVGRLDLIHEILAHVDADVIALNEADDPQIVDCLAQRLGMASVWTRGAGDRHNATLSRLPIVAHWTYNTPPLTQSVIETTLAWGSDQITIYNTHLRPRLLWPYELRRWQAVGRLLQIIRAHRPGPHLIMGDLNAVAPGDRVLHHQNPAPMRRQMALQLFVVFRWALPRLLRAGYVDCFRVLHPSEPGFTFMPGNPTTRYDYILADPDMAQWLVTCRVVDEIDAVQKASDHFPLMAEFAMLAPPQSHMR